MLTALAKLTFDQILFLIVALIGVFLLSYNINTAPLTYDEFSVINRASFDSLNEVYLNTKETDVHPPLMLFFLFFWLKIAGSNVLLIKLPFLLAGISSIFLIYKLVKNWFNSTVAILTIAFFVSIQFTVLYSQLARPYILGLFFVLLFANYWTKIVKSHSSLLNSVLYIITATLCIYNHHYSLLQVVIIGVSGLFIIKREQIVRYLVINVIVSLLFLPNLIIMLSQIGYEGMSYIPEANLEHIFNYLFYIFQFSIIPVTIVLGIIFFAFLKNKKVIANKYTLISLSWFLFPIVIGVIVSAIIKPVMPIRALIFSFPFLIIFLFSFVQKMSKPIIIAFIILILGSNIYGLVYNRNHYQIFQKDIAKTSIENIRQLLKNKTVNNPYVFYDYPKANLNFYRDKNSTKNNHETHFEYLDKDLTKPAQFREKIATLDNDAIILFGINNNLVSIVKEFYPYLTYRDSGFNYDFYCFSKNSSIDLEEFFYTSSIDFESENSEKDDNKIVIDSISSNHYYQFNKGDEWGPVLEVNIGEIIKDNYCIIETNVAVLTNNTNHDGHLVFEIVDNNEGVVWYSSQLSDFVSKNNKWQNIYFSDQLNRLGGSKRITDKSILKIYFWNKEKTPIAIDDLSVKIKTGNKEIYSLIYDFD